MIPLDVLERVLMESVTAEHEQDPVRAFFVAAFRLACDTTDPREVPKLFGADRATRRRLQRRALARAARLLQPKGELEWRTVVMLAQAVERFEMRVWPACKFAHRRLDPLDDALRLVFLAGSDFPRSAKRLHEELRGQDSPHLSVDSHPD